MADRSPSTTLDLTTLLKKHSPPPPFSFIFSHPAHLVACGFGSGLASSAPGTWATLLAWLTFPTMRMWLSDLELALFLITCLVGGIYAIQITGKALGEADHGSIVWDEIVPFWIILALCPNTLKWQAAAFILFRIFDIIKPPPARYFDKHVKNGLGVMADDIFAALYTLGALYAAQHFLA